MKHRAPTEWDHLWPYALIGALVVYAAIFFAVLILRIEGTL